jgi:hypothetical protein
MQLSVAVLEFRHHPGRQPRLTALAPHAVVGARIMHFRHYSFFLRFSATILAAMQIAEQDGVQMSAVVGYVKVDHDLARQLSPPGSPVRSATNPGAHCVLILKKNCTSSHIWPCYYANEMIEFRLVS